MAAVIRTIKLPSGKTITAKVPEEWGADEVRSALEGQGVDFRREGEGGGQPQAADMPNFGEGATINRAPPEQPKEPTFEDRLNRQLGLTARYAVQGAVALPGMVGDGVNGLLNYIPGVNLGSPSQAVHQALTDIGLPEPETKTERIVGATAETLASAGAGAPAAIATLPEKLAVKMTENIGAQAAGAAGAGAGMGYAHEKKLGTFGTLALGLVGGLAGAAGASSSASALARWMELRSASSKPFTVAEVEKAAKENGFHADPEKVAAVTEGANQFKDAANVRQATLDALVPDLKKDAVDVARAKSHAARKEFEDTIKGAFKDDAERKDFVERVVKAKQRDREIDATAPIEVKRARAKLGVSASRDAEIIAEIRARQEALMAKLEAERTTPETQGVRDAVKEANLKDSADVVRNSDVLRTATDEVPLYLVAGQKVIKRIENVAPRIAGSLRRVTANSNRRISAQVKRVMSWGEDKDIRRMIRKNPEYKAAVLNRDIDTMERLLPGSGAKYEPVAKLLDEYQGLLRTEGKAVIEEGIHPRAVIDVHKMRKALNREQKSQYDLAEKALLKEKGRKYLTEHEKAGLISQFVGGHPVKQFRGRTIHAVTPAQAKHYLDPQASLYDYIHGIEENIATKEFFKNTLGEDIPLGQTLNHDVLEGHIGDVIRKGLDDGDLQGHDVTELAKNLDAHFGLGRAGPHRALKRMKDLFTGLTLGYNPLSTATQIADIGISAVRFGPRAALKGLFGKDVVDVYDSGLRNMASDFRRNQDKWAADFVHRGLKVFGFHKVDMIGNKVAMNAAFHKRALMADRAPGALRKQLEPLFGAEDTTKIIDDLRAGRYSDDVATLMVHDVADIRPIGREDMPLSYSQNPNGRVLYSMLSWSINQLNYVRNAAFKDMAEGARLMATAGRRAEGLKKAARGSRNLATLLIGFGLANVPAGIIKDMMQGKELNPVDHFVAGTVPFGMTSKFVVESLMSHDPGSAAGKALPALSIPLATIGGVLSGAVKGDIPKVIKAVPAGRSLYNILTGDGIKGVVKATEWLGKQMIPEAGAAYAPGNYDPAAGAEYLPQPLVPADNNLPAGAEALPDPFGGGPRTRPVSHMKPAEQFKASKELIAKREGNKSQSYTDKLGKLTGGIGHLLTKAERAKYPEGTEIPQKVRDEWFKKDSAKAFNAARKQAREIGRPDMVDELASVNFQLGTDWNSKFKKTWKLLKDGQWLEAAEEAARSKWNEQTPVRVQDFQRAIREGIK